MMANLVRNSAISFLLIIFIACPAFSWADDDFGEDEGAPGEEDLSLPADWQGSEWVSEAANQRMLERQMMYATDGGSLNETAVSGQEAEDLPFSPLPANVDADGDGLSDVDELWIRTDTANKDTDGDGYIDGVEVFRGYNPLVASPEDKIIWAEPEGVDKLLNSQDYKITDVRRETENGKELLVVTGLAPGNSVAAVFVFSDQPMVLMGRADKTGRFRVTGDDVLESGDHRVYVGRIDAAGSLITGGAAVSFVKNEEGIRALFPSVAATDQGASKESSAGSRAVSNWWLVLGTLMVLGLGMLVYFVLRIRLAKRG